MSSLRSAGSETADGMAGQHESAYAAWAAAGDARRRRSETICIIAWQQAVAYPRIGPIADVCSRGHLRAVASIAPTMRPPAPKAPGSGAPEGRQS